MPKFSQITIKNMFDRPFTIKAVIIERKFHGFNTRGGGWSLYRLHEDDTPAEFLVFREFRKRRSRSVNVNNVVDIDGEKP